MAPSPTGVTDGDPEDIGPLLTTVRERHQGLPHVVGACSLHYASRDPRHLRSGVEDRPEAVLRRTFPTWRDRHVQNDLAVNDR